SDYSLCFHKVEVLKDGESGNDEEIEKRYNKITSRPITVKDIIEQGNFIHTASVVFRNELDELPWEFNYTPVVDYFIFIILAQTGYIKRIDEKMAVYRRNVGIYSTLTNFEMTKKILMYQSAILSYLDDPLLKKILLKRQFKIIENLKIS